MMIEHRGKMPRVHETAYVAPTATICGDVVIGPHSRVMFGTTVVAEEGTVRIGRYCILREQVVVRGSADSSMELGDNVIVESFASLLGCSIGDFVLISNGAHILNGARVGNGSQIGANSIVFERAVLPDNKLVPFGNIAIGQDPLQILGPHEQGKLWHIQRNLWRTEARITTGPFVPGNSESKLVHLTQKLSQSLFTHSKDNFGC